jgi:hypothetical protein
LPYELTGGAQPAPQRQQPPPIATPPSPPLADQSQQNPIEPELSPFDQFGDFTQTELSFDSAAAGSAAGQINQNEAGVDDWIWSGDPGQVPGSGQINVAERTEADLNPASQGVPLFGQTGDVYAETNGPGLVDLALPPAAPPPPPAPPAPPEAVEPTWPDDDGAFTAAAALEQTVESTFDEVTPDFSAPLDDPLSALSVQTEAAADREPIPKPGKSRPDRFPDPVIDDPQAGNPWVSGLWIGGAVAAIIGIILVGTVTSQITSAIGTFFINTGALGLVAAAGLSAVHWWSRRSLRRRD